MSCLQFPDGKEIQINLTGFLNAKNARQFMCELWDLLLSAMDNIGGIPAKFVEQKKEEIKRRQVSYNFKFKKGIYTFPTDYRNHSYMVL